MKTLKRHCDNCAKEYTTFAAEAIQVNFCSAVCAAEFKADNNGSDNKQNI